MLAGFQVRPTEFPAVFAGDHHFFGSNDPPGNVGGQAEGKGRPKPQPSNGFRQAGVDGVLFDTSS